MKTKCICLRPLCWKIHTNSENKVILAAAARVINCTLLQLTYRLLLCTNPVEGHLYPLNTTTVKNTFQATHINSHFQISSCTALWLQTVRLQQKIHPFSHILVAQQFEPSQILSNISGFLPSSSMTSILSPSTSWPTNRNPLSSKWLFSSGLTFTRNTKQTVHFKYFVLRDIQPAGQLYLKAMSVSLVHIFCVPIKFPYNTKTAMNTAWRERLLLDSSLNASLTQNTVGGLKNGSSLPKSHCAAHLPWVVFWHVNHLGW